jgi:hypothetical protein
MRLRLKNPSKLILEKEATLRQSQLEGTLTFQLIWSQKYTFQYLKIK